LKSQLQRINKNKLLSALKKALFSCVVLLGIVFIFPLITLAEDINIETGSALDYSDFKEYKGVLGVGLVGIRLDTKIKITNKNDGFSIGIDPENNLDMPESKQANLFYGRYRLGRKSTIGGSYFSIQRSSTLYAPEIILGDVVILEGYAELDDKTRFYFFDYSHSFYQDDRSEVKYIFGISGLDLKYALKAEGQITIGDETTVSELEEDVSVFAPLPLFGMDVEFALTPKWALSTRLLLIAGKYEDITAGIIEARTYAAYSLSKRFGIIFGHYSFGADVSINNKKENQEIDYSYSGIYGGLHFMF